MKTLRRTSTGSSTSCSGGATSAKAARCRTASTNGAGRIRTELPLSFDYISDNRAFIGTPDQCSAKIAELRAQGVEYFGCNFAMGGIPHDKVMRSMQLFADEVMPRFVG